MPELPGHFLAIARLSGLLVCESRYRTTRIFSTSSRLPIPHHRLPSGRHRQLTNTLPPPNAHFYQDVAMRPFELFAVVVLIAADAGDDAAKKDLEKFQGNWQLISAERDGKKTPDEDAKKITLTIQGNKFVLRKDGVIISEGTMTLDPTKKPKEIDETITTGPNKGKEFSAIYEIDDEHHKICFAAAGKARPTVFSSLAGSGQLLQVWQREKK
jgi:uncharacterized protein (TIGR03067 family)